MSRVSMWSVETLEQRDVPSTFTYQLWSSKPIGAATATLLDMPPSTNNEIYPPEDDGPISPPPPPSCEGDPIGGVLPIPDPWSGPVG